MPILDLPVSGEMTLDAPVAAIRVNSGSLLIQHPDIQPLEIGGGGEAPDSSEDFDAEDRVGLRLLTTTGANFVVAYTDGRDFSRAEVLGEDQDEDAA
jgi:hypothetical protein